MDPWTRGLWPEALGEFFQAMVLSSMVCVVTALVGAIIGLLVVMPAKWLKSVPLPGFRRARFAALCGTLVGSIPTIMIWTPVLVFRNTFGHPRAESLSRGADLFVLCHIAWMIGISGTLAFVVAVAASLKSPPRDERSKPTAGSPSAQPIRWRQFSLGTLFVVTALIAVGLGMVKTRVEQLRSARGPVEEWERIGARPGYERGKLVELRFNAQAELSEASLGKLEGLADLRTLHLSHTKIGDAGLEHLKGLTNLHTLHLIDAPIGDAGLEHISGLTGLHTLYLRSTQVSDAGLKHLGELLNLRKLFLNGTQVGKTQLEHLARLARLQTLSLRDTHVTDAGLEHIKGLVDLRTLFLSDTKITGAGLANLKGLTSLAHLELNNTQVTDAGLIHVKGLKRLSLLYLANTRVSDAGLKHLRGLTSLRWLDLGGTQVTNEGVRKLGAALPECKITH